MNTAEKTLFYLMDALPELNPYHSSATQTYKLLETVARTCILSLFGKTEKCEATFGKFGKIQFPYFSMGAVDSTHLFGLDELILFSFYWMNRFVYSRVYDLGANIGLHSIAMSRAGYDVVSYEPDPVHFWLLLI